MTDYELFTPAGFTYSLKNPNFPDSQDGFLVIIPVYYAVPLGVEDGSVIVEKKYFCSLGKFYNHFVVDIQEVESRLDPKIRRADYEAVLKNSEAQPFGVWDSKGNATTIPRIMFADPTSYVNFNAWDEEQSKRWNNIFTSIDNATPNVPYSVYARFIQPPVELGIELYFTPNDKAPIFKSDDLRTIFRDAFASKELSLPQYPYKVLEWNEPLTRNPKLQLVGSHYLGFYHTWMSPADFKKLWDYKRTPDLLRPWPDHKTANDVDLALHKGKSGERDGEVTTVNLSHYKATEAVGKRGLFPGQKEVQGASATDVAIEFWKGAVEPKNRPSDAEWLHRNAFHFGGLEDKVDLGSSQNRRNLVFGTGESNTHMIRAENTISHLLAADTKVTQDNKRTGTLVTTNVWTGDVSRISATGVRTDATIPSWVGEKYMWLSLNLKYVWTMKSAVNNLTFNANISFDPFSRYIPLRVEARLDDVLMNKLLEHSLGVNTSSVNTLVANNSVSSSSLVSFALRAGPRVVPPLSASFNQEPMLAWHAIRAELPSVMIGGVKLRNPVVAQPPHELGRSARRAPVAHEGLPLRLPGTATRGNEVVVPQPPLEAPLPIVTAPDSLPPSSGFVLVGDISLFGVGALTAKLEVWEGPPPAGVFIRPDEPASVQRATLEKDFHFSSIIPALKGTPFDKIIFRNVTFYHQNYLFDPTKALGWHFNADWVVDNSAGTLHDVLSNVLGVKEPVLNIHAGFGTEGGWDKPFEVNSFTLEGVFAGISATPVDGLVLTRIGVRLFGIRSMKYTPKPHSVLEYGFGVFGSMNINVPGSVVPLDLDYEIREFGGTLHLSADLATWDDPLGAKGITLTNTSFSTSFSLASPWKSFAFDIATSFQYKLTSADFTGSYAPGGVFELTATVNDFNTDTISDFFEFISNGRLSIPEVDVTIGTATISIGTEKGLDILLQDIDIGGYKAPEAALAITSHSVLLRGDLASDNIEFGDIQVNRAFLQIVFETTDSGKTTDVIIGGQVTFTSLTFDAAVHLYPADEGEKGVEWTVLAALTVADGSLALSKIVPEVSGTFLDLSLTQVTFVAASKDDPSLGNMITSGYEFHQGVQVCATLSQIDALDSLMRGPVAGLVLSAGWSKATGFELDVLLPAPTTLNLGNGVTTTPFKLGIQTSPVELTLSAGLKIPVAHSPDPLVFTLSLGTNLLTASATGELAGWWVNPFGISENVKVGPNLALSIDIILAQFVSTGTPSGFGIRGGLVIGKAEAQLALIINEDPMKELLSAEVKALNLTDVVSFAEDIIGVSIPEPPSDFLDFEDVKLYICPAAVTLGTITYPQGFSFMADMVLFGKRADIACAVNDGQVTVKGGVDNFELGPLSVRGTTGPRALVDCSFGPTAQHVLIDGVITFFDAEAAVHIEAAVLPEPKFLFYTFLKFTDLLTFQLNAELIGNLDFKSLQNSDFTFDAKLEQHILQYIHDQLILQFDKAREVAEDGINSAQSKVDAAQKALNDGIDKAQADLNAAYATWDSKNKSVTESSQKIIDAYNAEITKLQGDINIAQADFNAAMENAQHAVQGANIDRAQQLAAAQHAVDDANIAMVNGINDAQGALDRAVDDMNRQFGSAQRDIENARNNVQSLQNQINDLWNTVHDYENAPWYEFWKKGAIAGLMVSIGTLEASKGVADGVLQGAQAVLTSANYLGKEAAIGAARQALNLAQQTGSAALSGAKDVLRGVDTATQAAVDAANDVLKATQTGVQFVALEGAKQALQAYKEANTAIFEAATAALEGLLQSVEYLAYLAATAALDIARGATVELEAAKAALELAREATKAALGVAKWVIEHGTQVFDIRVVHLSGSLRGIVGIDGATSKPLTAHIEGVVVDQPFTLDGEFDPRKTADFITTIFKSLWNDIEKLADI